MNKCCTWHNADIALRACTGLATDSLSLCWLAMRHAPCGMRYAGITEISRANEISDRSAGRIAQVFVTDNGSGHEKFNTCSHYSLYCPQLIQIAAIEVNELLCAIRDPTAWWVDRVDADLR